MRAFLLACLGFVALVARAHVGSPDLFHAGSVGPYATRITIRMPDVIPGRAEIAVRVETTDALEVSFLPLYAKTAIKNAPPPDIGRLVKGEVNLYSGELWLMDFGAYSVEVRVMGEKGSGSVQIPLTSVATRQLPMPSLLGKVLAFLGVTLLIGGIGIATSAAREATLPPGQIPGRMERRKGWIAAGVTTVIFAAALVGGRIWWQNEESAFRRHLREGSWPDLSAEVETSRGQRILQLELAKQTYTGSYKPPLIPDHGKLMHLFLIREGSRNAFAHLHPVRKQGYQFEVAVPPLPAGRYTIFTDLTFEGGTSSTAMTTVELPALSAADSSGSTQAVEADADDSWANYPEESVPKARDSAPVFRTAEGVCVSWKKEGPLRIRRDASLRFEVADPAGKPFAIEQYMGMLCHAAVLRSDGTVFAHLHPSGNYSMAAQSFFASKLEREAAGDSKSGGEGSSSSDAHNVHMHHGGSSTEAVSSVYLPYEFPETGEYRVWVQFKAGGRVHTAAFDASVAE